MLTRTRRRSRRARRRRSPQPTAAPPLMISIILRTYAFWANTPSTRARSSSPRAGLGLAQQGQAPPMLSQLGQRAIHSEAEIEGQYPGIAVLGQVIEGLEGLLVVAHPLTECGAVVGLAPACWR